ncbi:glycosyl hydrolase catalytic core domain-containing protein [Hirsutella rhossiliensis]|uniref:Glycosyl hydrolase catalytic core domain-containing protein n=1 Tax=Hirsutella rhossiliensis TaxID=111463 RepID=A0A9P8N854_9HYPO|nr:glycosyl hydrolase catalytic core domain-containing protein [Hirsutella rhossiliensis]KAH0967736.1 glycosyl hydrolase catalytic core domain-containing protein [Hirsutella rhossiliensis]
MRLLAGLLAASALGQAASSKRGLCFTPNENHPEDNQVWVKPGSDLKWYYNYQSLPSPAYAGLSQEELEYIPMMWGLGPNPNDTTFFDQVKKLVDEGRNIQRVLAFNEPDADASVGGSNVKPQDAAQAWVANFEPLGRMGIKLGLPACTGGRGGLPWLKQFLGNCSDLVSTAGERKNCTWDFLPVHWYDNFAGLASHIGERKATWPDAEIWITEYAYAHQDLGPTQDFFKQTVDYFDKLDYIGRYSYFGAFRANKANVGPNAAFLSNGGQLTDIGSWYLGFDATGNGFIRNAGDMYIW